MSVTAPERKRVRHPVPPAKWPTREEAARSRWFSPITLGTRLVAAERTWVPAMVPWRATDDGFVTQDVLDWNTPSIRFYRKLGAKLRREWILTRLTGAPLRRLARAR